MMNLKLCQHKLDDNAQPGGLVWAICIANPPRLSMDALLRTQLLGNRMDDACDCQIESSAMADFQFFRSTSENPLAR
jgi:hypothetical protein